MGKVTGIEWTDHTFNYLWGCQEVSEGCAHCYARTLAERWGYAVWGGPRSARRVMSDKYWAQPLIWNTQALREGRSHRVFTSSMADVFEAHPMAVTERARLFALIEDTPALQWQILTKRPEHILTMIPSHWHRAWPQNAWIMTSTENHRQASLRMIWMIEIREQTAAPIIGVSAEPLLGDIHFTALSALDEQRVAQMLRGTHDRQEAATLAARWRSLQNTYSTRYGDGRTVDVLRHRLLDWVIAGGESGPKHRPMALDWARRLRDDCSKHGVALFLKQIGGATPKAQGKALDGHEWCEFPDAMALARA